MTSELNQAKQNLQDYFDSLPPNERVKALAYQSRIEQEALTTNGGMSQVIINHMRHNAALMEDAVAEVSEIVAAHKTEEAIRKWRS